MFKFGLLFKVETYEFANSDIYKDKFAEIANVVAFYLLSGKVIQIRVICL